MEESQKCWCGKTPEGSNHFCSPGHFYEYHEAINRLNSLESELRTTSAAIDSLGKRISEFDEVAEQVGRLTAGCGQTNPLERLHADKDALQLQANRLQEDVDRLQKWMGF
jgi:hypothetical protein